MKSLESYYDSLSGIYDIATAEFSWFPPRKTAELILSQGIDNLWDVLEVGCWTAQLLEELEKRAILCENYVWIDISERMLASAQKKYPHHSYIHADIDNKEIIARMEDRFFHSIFAIGLLEFVEDPKHLLSFLQSRVHKQGSLYFTFENYGPEVAPPRIEVHKSGNDEFLSFRYNSEEIKSYIHDVFSLVFSDNFVGYCKTDKRIPVYYTIMHIRRL